MAYKQSGEVKEVSNRVSGARVCIQTDNGDEFWVDADQLQNK